MLTKTLYSKAADRSVRVWTIIAEENWLSLTWGTLNGATQQKTIPVKENKSGRNIAEQVLLEFNSRISKQQDKGYKASIEEAMAGRTNALELPKPMLAMPLSRVKNIDFSNAYVQRKYDGNRCLIARLDGDYIAYTRNGKEITTINHILDDLRMPEGTILDGEIYAHGHTLQEIVSWVKRKQSNTELLKYHIYDRIDTYPFQDRLDRLTFIDHGESVEIVPTHICTSLEVAHSYCDIFREEGYEGAIIRWGKQKYEDGKRSKSLVKVKKWDDAEFIVSNITQSADGWGILHMHTMNNIAFKATAPGTHTQKIEVGQNPEQYIGKLITIEYAYRTKDGVPFHPIAKAWRL